VQVNRLGMRSGGGIRNHALCAPGHVNGLPWQARLVPILLKHQEMPSSVVN